MSQQTAHQPDAALACALCDTGAAHLARAQAVWKHPLDRGQRHTPHACRRRLAQPRADARSAKQRPGGAGVEERLPLRPGAHINVPALVDGGTRSVLLVAAADRVQPWQHEREAAASQVSDHRGAEGVRRLGAAHLSSAAASTPLMTHSRWLFRPPRTSNESIHMSISFTYKRQS